MSGLPWQAHMLEAREALRAHRYDEALDHARAAASGASEAGASESDRRACRYYEADALLRRGEYPRMASEPEAAEADTLAALAILREVQPPTKPREMSRSLLGIAVSQALDLALLRRQDPENASALFQEYSLWCRAGMGATPSAEACLRLADVLRRPGLDWALGEEVARELREEAAETLALGFRSPGAERFRTHLAQLASFLVSTEADTERRERWSQQLQGPPIPTLPDGEE